MRPRVAFAAAVAAASLLFACGVERAAAQSAQDRPGSVMSPQPASPPREPAPKSGPTRADKIKLGGELYATHCISCHGPDLRGSADGPSLIAAGTAAADFMLSTGRMPIEVPYTEEQPGPPSFPADQIQALVLFLGSHGAGSGPAIPVLSPSHDLTRGRVVFEENCQACHGATGNGAVAGFGWIAPPLPIATDEQVAEAVRFGPGIMPRFDAHAIPQRDLDALVAYVHALRTPADPGGWSIEAAGPVGEGLIAFAIGLGTTLLVMRLVGEGTREEGRSELS